MAKSMETRRTKVRSNHKNLIKNNTKNCTKCKSENRNRDLPLEVRVQLAQNIFNQVKGATVMSNDNLETVKNELMSFCIVKGDAGPL